MRERKAKIKITYSDADRQARAEYYRLMWEETGEYLKSSVAAIGLDENRFEDHFHRTGRVRGIIAGGADAGFLWIEKREDVLHIHALILRREFQRRGLGKIIIGDLMDEFSRDCRIMEMGVYHRNEPALKLYKNLGFKTTRELKDIGYLVMQKPLIATAPAGGET